MLSTCPNCKNHLFEVVENSPAHANFRLWFVQCSKRGTPIGTHEFLNINNQVATLKEETEKLEKKVNNLEYMLNNIDGNIVKIARLIKS